MKKNYFFVAALLLCFGFNTFSQADNREVTIGLERYRDLDLKKMELQKINNVADDLQVLDLLYSENFDLGIPAGWTFSGNSASCIWAVDATANPPGYFSAPYSLNYNNGVDFECGYNYGAATSPLITVNSYLIKVDFMFIRDTESAEGDIGGYDALWVSILDESDNILYSEGLPESTNWLSYSLLYQIPQGVSRIKVEFYFDTGDDIYNTFKGVFVDNLVVSRGPMIPLSNWAVFIGILLVATTIFIRFRRSGS